MLTRRAFNLGLTSTAFAGLGLAGCANIPGYRTAPMRRAAGNGPLGPLRPAPGRLLDLPARLRYEIVSSRNDRMSDGHRVPDRADGMGSFRMDDRLMVLIRNHELGYDDHEGGPFRAEVSAPPGNLIYDTDWNERPLPGGTTTMIYDYRDHVLVRQHLSLVGTIRNCAGGATPWGSWLTCEEDVSSGREGFRKDHGWVFEVPAHGRGLTEPQPLRQMGRFYHEAAAVDPETYEIYLTEDRNDGLFYRFVPDRHDAPTGSGTLWALAFEAETDGRDSRNWAPEGRWNGAARRIRWIKLNDLADISSPADDLRSIGYNHGAVRFAGGEGISFGRNEQGEKEVFFSCKSGGPIKSGQIMRYRPAPVETLDILVESTDYRALNYCDNLALAPNGDLIVCEDSYIPGEKEFLRGFTPEGEIYDIARLRASGELAGACFSPDGQILFINVYKPAKTLAVFGDWPWPHPRDGWGVPSVATGA